MELLSRHPTLTLFVFLMLGLIPIIFFRSSLEKFRIRAAKDPQSIKKQGLIFQIIMCFGFGIYYTVVLPDEYIGWTLIAIGIMSGIYFLIRYRA